MLSRREFLAGSLGMAAVPQAGGRAIRFAVSGYMWQKEIEQGIRAVARFGFHGIEPFRQHVLKYLDKPRLLKEQLDRAGVELVTCSNGGPMSVNFIDPAKVSQTVDDHFRFARDFLAHLGCRHFKINLGSRPANGPTDDQLKTMSSTLNRLGRRTAAIGIRLAPHPHIWSPLEREHEVRRVLELTDPDLVYLVMDSAHLTLGGMDPVELIRDYFPRVTALHWKDTFSKYRGYTGPTPTREEHRRVNLYKNLGAGGVDFPAIFRTIRERHFRGWITLDLDPPRPGDGTIAENLDINKRYLRDVLKVNI